jgi:iron(III) transport system permease protein
MHSPSFRLYNWPRGAVTILTVIAVFLPLMLVFYQSFLSAPFFMPMAAAGLDAYRFIAEDPEFAQAFWNGLQLATGLALIAVPLGGMLAFVMVRTDLPGRSWIAPLLLVPIFVSPMVLGFGYVVSMGPVGFYSTWVKDLIGFVPWNVYSFTSIVIIAGLTHVPHVYLYASSALKSLGSDVEEAARVAGASPLQVMFNVSLPMIMPALAYAGVLVFFLGFEVFGLVLVLGDPEGHLVLPTYLYKLTNKLGTPSYHLMAAVAVCLVAVTMPLVMLQRWLLQSANKYVSIKGKGGAPEAAAAGELEVAGAWPAGPVAGVYHRVSLVRHCLAFLRAVLGRRREAGRRAHPAALPRHPGTALASAWHRQHGADRRDRRCAGRGVLQRHRTGHAPQERCDLALAGLQRAGAARRAWPAGRAGLPVGIPVRACLAGWCAEGNR